MKPKSSTHLIVLILLFVLSIFTRCEMFQSNKSLTKGSHSYLSTPYYSDDPYFQHLFGRLNSETNKATLLAQMDSLYTVGHLKLHQLNDQLLQQQSTASYKASLEYSFKISQLKDSLASIKMCRNTYQIQVLEASKMQSNRQLEQAKTWCFGLMSLLFFMIGTKLFPFVFSRIKTQDVPSLIHIKNDDLEDKNTDEHADISMQKNIIDEEHLHANGLFITLTNREKTRLKLVDILYVQADSGGVNYHTAHGVYFNWQSLKSCLHLLPEPSFVQISKTVVVARPAIIGKTKSMVRIINNAELSIGRAFQDKINDE
jgi:hypothetical protein